MSRNGGGRGARVVMPASVVRDDRPVELSAERHIAAAIMRKRERRVDCDIMREKACVVCVVVD